MLDALRSERETFSDKFIYDPAHLTSRSDSFTTEEKIQVFDLIEKYGAIKTSRYVHVTDPNDPIAAEINSAPSTARLVHIIPEKFDDMLAKYCHIVPTDEWGDPTDNSAKTNPVKLPKIYSLEKVRGDLFLWAGDDCYELTSTDSFSPKDNVFDYLLANPGIVLTQEKARNLIGSKVTGTIDFGKIVSDPRLKDEIRKAFLRVSVYGVQLDNNLTELDLNERMIDMKKFNTQLKKLKKAKRKRTV